MPLKTIIFAALFLLAADHSVASPVWTFEILNPKNTIQQSDSLEIFGRITNSNSSTETLDFISPCQGCAAAGGILIGAAFESQNIFDIFTIDTGPAGADNNIVSPLYGRSLQPGKSVSLLIYTMSPKYPDAPTGKYEFSINDLWLSGHGFSSGGPVQINVVPLPSSIIFILSAICSLRAIAVKQKIRFPKDDVFR